MRRTRIFWLLLALTGLLGTPSKSHAIISIGIEPIVGYERTQLFVPDRHTKDRLMYGFRVTGGILLLSLEGELTRATSTDNFPDLGLSTEDIQDRAKLGLRSTIKLIGIVYAFARAGGQASQNKHKETVGGVTTETTGTIKVHPYAGAGLRVKLGKNFEGFADATVVFGNYPSLDYNDYQTAAGFTVRFP